MAKRKSYENKSGDPHAKLRSALKRAISKKEIKNVFAEAKKELCGFDSIVEVYDIARGAAEPSSGKAHVLKHVLQEKGYLQADPPAMSHNDQCIELMTKAREALLDDEGQIDPDRLRQLSEIINIPEFRLKKIFDIDDRGTQARLKPTEEPVVIYEGVNTLAAAYAY